MTPTNPPQLTTQGPRWRAGHYVLGALLLFLLMSMAVVWGFFQLGSDTQTLRQTLMSSLGGHWNTKVTLHAGFFSTTLVRAGSRFFTLPPEPRAALEAVRGVEVGVYELTEETAPLNCGAILLNADRAMTARGWDRAVGVTRENELVAVYMPHGKMGVRHVKCCLMVLERRNLVVLSAIANVEPLLQLAQQRLGPVWREHCSRLGSAQPVRRNNSNPQGSSAKVVASNMP